MKISAKSISKALDDGKEILVEAVQAAGGLKTVESNIDRKDVLSFTIHNLSSIVISKSEIQTKTGHTIWADEELGVYLTGKMPSGGIVQAIPVKVEIDGQETLAAYDIRIFTNQNRKSICKCSKWLTMKIGFRIKVHPSLNNRICIDRTLACMKSFWGKICRYRKHNL